MPGTIFAYDIAPQQYVYHTGSGRLDLVRPTPQNRRIKECFVAYVVLKGELNLTDFLPEGPEQFRVRSGEMHIIAPGLAQMSTVPSAPNTRMLWIHFSFVEDPVIGYLATPAEAATAVYANLAGGRPSWLLPRHLAFGREIENFLRLYNDLSDYARLYGKHNTGCHEICGHLISLLHRTLGQRLLRSSAKDCSPQQAHVERARNFIRMNYDKKISLSEVAEALGLSAPYLSRCFQRSTGQSVVDFLLSTRVQAAKELLVEQSLSVKEVAFQTGFSSPIYFCRIFRRLVKKTALEYATEARRKFERRH